VEIRLGAALESLSPIELQGRTIASTFWGKAWCTNLEAYSDYANRLPRGRSYVRNGSVIDASSTDPVVQGVRRLGAVLGAEPRVSATAIQTVGSKGYDGFAIALVER
jgi:hypothetical protein